MFLVFLCCCILILCWTGGVHQYTNLWHLWGGLLEETFICSSWSTPCWSKWMAHGRLWLHEKSRLKQVWEVGGPMRREARTGAGLLAGLMTCWGSLAEQSVTEGLRPVEGTQAGAVDKGLSHGWDSMLEQGRSVGRKEWHRQPAMNWPQSPFPCGTWGRGKEIRGDPEPRKKGDGGIFKICAYFSLSYSYLISNELNYFLPT